MGKSNGSIGVIICQSGIAPQKKQWYSSLQIKKEVQLQSIRALKVPSAVNIVEALDEMDTTDQALRRSDKSVSQDQ